MTELLTLSLSFQRWFKVYRRVYGLHAHVYLIPQETWTFMDFGVLRAVLEPVSFGYGGMGLLRWQQKWRVCLPMQETWETQVWSLGQEDPLEEGWQPNLVFLPGESHGQKSLVGYSPWGHRESDIAEVTAHTCTHGGMYV